MATRTHPTEPNALAKLQRVVSAMLDADAVGAGVDAACCCADVAGFVVVVLVVVVVVVVVGDSSAPPTA